MSKYIIFTFFFLFTFSLSIHLREETKTSNGYCSGSDQVVYLEPKLEIFRDPTKTFGLLESFFLGTGAEVHSKAPGKIVFKKEKIIL